MTKHNNLQNGIFWNILEYSGTLYMKGQRINNTLLKIILKSLTIFLSLRTTTKTAKKRIFLANLTYNCAKYEIVCS